jgi:hypothetical protein
MSEHYYGEMKAGGATEAELAQTKEFMEMYKNPVVRFGVSLTEILPVGILISLLSAGLLSRKNFLSKQQSSTL